jgi:hypothetical protein
MAWMNSSRDSFGVASMAESSEDRGRSPPILPNRQAWRQDYLPHPENLRKQAERVGTRERRTSAVNPHRPVRPDRSSGPAGAWSQPVGPASGAVSRQVTRFARPTPTQDGDHQMRDLPADVFVRPWMPRRQTRPRAATQDGLDRRRARAISVGRQADRKGFKPDEPSRNARDRLA